MTETRELPIQERAGQKPRKLVNVDVLVRDQQGRILLVGKPDWAMPGGAVPDGEAPREAARRLLHDQIALDRAPSRLLVVDYVTGEDRLDLVFDGGTIRAEDYPRFAFCDPSEAGERLPESGRPRLAAACEGLRFQVSRYLEDGTMLA
ncbi:NUDIX domain-containing protein [Cryptosporangium phraense]|uniref:NUDIX domain-containing protein n=1 Tax=Cryptosporangium phraense TaxID=2593070 RepID=UPI00147920E3|nr:NUDIX domain-containing protein [Cryptosporangium phraense]